jgi:hypothetical protein
LVGSFTRNVEGMLAYSVGTHAAGADRDEEVRRAGADVGELELKLRWVELHYWPDLAPRVRAYLAARSR